MPSGNDEFSQYKVKPADEFDQFKVKAPSVAPPTAKPVTPAGPTQSAPLAAPATGIGPQQHKSIGQQLEEWWTTAKKEHPETFAEKSPRGKVAEVGKGAAVASLPLLGYGLVTAPLVTLAGGALGAAGTYAGAKGGKAIGEKVGAPTLGEDLGASLLGLAGGVAGARMAPSAARAGKALALIEDKAVNLGIPVKTQSLDSWLMEAKQLKVWNAMPKAVTALIRGQGKKLAPIGPGGQNAPFMDFDEARRAFTALGHLLRGGGSLSIEDQAAIKVPQVKGMVKQLYKAIGEEIVSAAEQVGAGEGAKYQKALVSYRRAIRASNSSQTIAKLVAKAALIGGAGEVGWQVAKALVHF